jgi:rod shape-determining protein MreC
MVSIAKRPGWIALVSVLVFNLLLLSLQTNQRGSPGVMRKWLLNIMVPAEKLVDTGIRGIWSVWDGYFALIGVRSENDKLHTENDQLRMQIQGQDEEIREAARLRSFLGMADAGIGKTVAARVIGRNPTRFLQTVTIDRGQSDGVKTNDSVITPDGVVGRVLSVASGSAVVQLITDAQSEIAGVFQESRVQALFRGTGGRELELSYIDDDYGIEVGAEVITSGLDQIHPKGVPLATISSVGEKKEHFKVMFARPRVDLSRLENVLVVIEHARPKGDAPEPQNHPEPNPASPAVHTSPRTDG